VRARIAASSRRPLRQAAAGIDHRDRFGAEDEADIGDSAAIVRIGKRDGRLENKDPRRHLLHRQGSDGVRLHAGRESEQQRQR
jgi:hypothetical protein